MRTLTVEIRDRLTFIAAVAIEMTWANEVERYYQRRCGFEGRGDQVILLRLDNQEAHSDPYDWRDRTMRSAHIWLTENFAKVADGDVVDVRVILGEAAEPVKSERLEHPL